MIVSDQHVLFIDPSRQYLTGRRKCIKLLLATVQQYVLLEVTLIRDNEPAMETGCIRINSSLCTAFSGSTKRLTAIKEYVGLFQFSCENSNAN